MIGLCTQPDVWKSVIVSVNCGIDFLEARLYPVEIMLKGKRGLKGLPVLTSDLAIIEKIKTLSMDFGTEIKIANKNFGSIRISRV